MPKSGPYSLTVVSLTLAHLSFMAFMPKESKDEFFYIAKVSRRCYLVNEKLNHKSKEWRQLNGSAWPSSYIKVLTDSTD